MSNNKRSIAPSALEIFKKLPAAPSKSAENNSGYVDELLSEIETLRRQIEGALIRAGNVFEFRRFRLTPTMLIAPNDMNELEFDELGYALSSLSGAVNFWMGDWVNFYLADAEKQKGGELSEQERGVIYEELKDRFAFDGVRSLQQYASVCRILPPSMRVEGVSYTHHQLIAFLPEELKGRETELFQKVVDEKLSTRQLDGLIHKMAKGLLLPVKSPSPTVNFIRLETIVQNNPHALKVVKKLASGKVSDEQWRKIAKILEG